MSESIGIVGKESKWNMANFQKHGRNAVGNLGRHYERKTEDGKYIKYKNQEIKPERTHLNYNLAPNRGMSSNEFVAKRTSEVKCLKRKDVNIMCSWVVTLPKTIKSELDEGKFFQETYKFLENKYGKQNVVSSFVHKDENQPHMHFAFIPIVQDKKKGHYKVSAKECVTRKDLQSFHNELSKCMEKTFGRDIGILNEATRNGNKSIEELKRQSAQEKLKDVREKARDVIEKARIELNSVEVKTEAKRAEYDFLDTKIEHVKNNCSEMAMYPDWAKKSEKGIINKTTYVTVPRDKWESKHMYNTEKEAIETQKEVLNDKIDQLINSDYYKMLTELKSEIKELKSENKELKSELRELENTIDKVFTKNPELEQQFNKTVDRINREINRGIDRGRGR